jgi:outer membrane protein OmpA-like peptidoglycan-associated protein
MLGERSNRERRAGRGRAALAALVVALCVAGCGAGQTLILVPDPDGHTGQAEVSTAGGKQVLSKPGDMTTVAGPRDAPAAVTTAAPELIAKTFGQVLAVEPPPAERFVLYFETGTTVLDAKSRSAVSAIAAAAKKRAAVSVAISGHTDATGSDSTNEKLALARAERVKALLLEQGVQQDAVTVSSHGKGNPAVPTPGGVAEPRNRRVEVIVH